MHHIDCTFVLIIVVSVFRPQFYNYQDTVYYMLGSRILKLGTMKQIGMTYTYSQFIHAAINKCVIIIINPIRANESKTHTNVTNTQLPNELIDTKLSQPRASYTNSLLFVLNIIEILSGLAKLPFSSTCALLAGFVITNYLSTLLSSFGKWV